MAQRERDDSAIAVANGEADSARPTGTLRPIESRDLSSIVELVCRSMNSSEARQARTTLDIHFASQQKLIDDGRLYWVLVSTASDVQGIVGLHHYHWGPAENVWLAWFAVAPMLQGTGLGTQLMDFVAAKALTYGYSKLFVETYSTPEFAAARRFYRKYDFRVGGRIHSYLPCGGDMIVYLKDLTTHV